MLAAWQRIPTLFPFRDVGKFLRNDDNPVVTIVSVFIKYMIFLFFFHKFGVIISKDMMTGSDRRIYLIFIVLALMLACNGPASKHISILETTDIHGAVLPYDYIEKEDISASLASAFSYIRHIRDNRDAVVLLDNGDNLQIGRAHV